LSIGVLWWNQKIDVPKDATSRFIQYEVAQRLILGYPIALLPQGVTRRRCNTANNYVTNLTFGVA
jgi:hypothetical protein